MEKKKKGSILREHESLQKFCHIFRDACKKGFFFCFDAVFGVFAKISMVWVVVTWTKWVVWLVRAKVCEVSGVGLSVFGCV